MVSFITTRIPDEFCAMQTLYLLDRFGVSNELYHELTQVNLGILSRQHIQVSFCYRAVAWVTGYCAYNCSLIGGLAYIGVRCVHSTCMLMNGCELNDLLYVARCV